MKNNAVKNNTVKGAAIALAIALPLLAIGVFAKVGESACTVDTMGAASEQTSKPAQSLSTVSTEKATVKPDAASKNNASLTMDKNAQPCYSSTKFLVLVDLTAQQVGIYTGKKNAWKQVKSFVCSSGALGSQTPTGKFRIQNRGTWFYNKSLGEGAKWWVGFDGDYLFHSLPMNEKREVTCETLGKPLSHGCVRLAIENAKWMYDNIPQNSTAFIYS